MSEKIISLGKIQEFQRQFSAERDWDQFHTPKNLAMALIGESAELSEIFQWLTAEQSLELKQPGRQKTAVEEELADVFFYVARLADILEIDLEKAVWQKLEKNAKKYPVEKAKGNAKKYTEWEDQ